MNAPGAQATPQLSFGMQPQFRIDPALQAQAATIGDLASVQIPEFTPRSFETFGQTPKLSLSKGSSWADSPWLAAVLKGIGETGKSLPAMMAMASRGGQRPRTPLDVDLEPGGDYFALSDYLAALASDPGRMRL